MINIASRTGTKKESRNSLKRLGPETLPKKSPKEFSERATLEVAPDGPLYNKVGYKNKFGSGDSAEEKCEPLSIFREGKSGEFCVGLSEA